MKIAGQHHRGVAFDEASASLRILDQTLLPFNIQWLSINSFLQVCDAIQHMQVRGAPAIGAVAAYGIVLAIKEGREWQQAANALKATRPTAVNLAWAVDRMLLCLQNTNTANAYHEACIEAQKICEEDVLACSSIGDYGLAIIEDIQAKKPGQTINILTHCNAGWLATVDWGTALAPIYKAHEKGLDVHVWVDETRPRNQGALLTCFELKEQGVKHTLIADNAGGFLMQQGKVDMCIVGSDRTAANGDVCNKIGTYLKALAAYDNGVPFYVALPCSTIDWSMESGANIPIEYRSQQEVLECLTLGSDNKAEYRSVTLAGTQALNPAFDVTPAHLVSGLITEYGVFAANVDDLQVLKRNYDNAR